MVSLFKTDLDLHLIQKTEPIANKIQIDLK